MKAIDAIRSSLNTSFGFGEALLKDMADEPMTRWQPDVGQHAYWLLGHMVWGEAAALDQHIQGKVNRFELWRPLFGAGTEPNDTVAGGPTYEELLEALSSVRSSTLEYIDQLAEDDLDKPCHPVEPPAPQFGSIGACLLAISIHMGYHTGQLACARRAAGREPLFF